MFGGKTEEKVEDKSEDKVQEKVEKTGKVTWVKLDGKSEIELFDTPNLAKKAEELGWTKKGDK